MSELREYECPQCGGRVEFDPESQLLHCPYCDSSFDPESFAETLETAAEEKEARQKAGGGRLEFSEREIDEWSAEESEGLFNFTCESCGGQILADESLAATNCPYCDNPVVIMSRFSQKLKPNWIIPFKKTKAEAIEAFRQHAKSKKLVPDIFSADSHLQEVKGVYVPYWLLSCDAAANASFTAERVSEQKIKGEIHETKEIYRVLREGVVHFDHVPVEASSKHDVEMLESIEPFDFSELQDFSPAYLSGYLADKYDRSAEESRPRADERIRQTMRTAFDDTLDSKYRNYSLEDLDLELLNGEVNYVLLPVWFLNTRWDQKLYRFAMNGQSGELIGNLPEDPRKVLRYRLIYGVIAAIIAIIAAYFIAPLFVS
ncbi:MAG: hypothetical protein Q4P08_04705 [Eubacteriales bacterium]|nr:hypothetical protein [Eubacteriales bacterium]